MSQKIEVGDELVGSSQSWSDVRASVLFVGNDGQSGDIQLEDGAVVTVTFNNFKKVS